MENQIIPLLFSTIPQFMFAIVLYWMCEKNKETARQTYSDIIKDYNKLLTQVIDNKKD